MFEDNTREWEARVLERGIEQGIERGKVLGREEGREALEKRDFEITQKLIENGMSDTDIRKITGLSVSKIRQIRKSIKR